MIRGIVKEGEQQARNLFSIKTANLEIPKNSEEGIFAALVKLDEKEYKAIAYIGNAHLLAGEPKRVEVHLFDYHEDDFYGKQIEIDLKQKIRDVVVFTSEIQAMQQIDKDIEDVKEFFKL